MRMGVLMWMGVLAGIGCAPIRPVAGGSGIRSGVLDTSAGTSIVFPHFFEKDAMEVGAQDGPYELDGATLRALTLAANDFLPQGAGRSACWDRQEAHRYRVIREGDVIFVRIDEDPVSCGRPVPALHSGARYAISTDGRVLRRLLDGEAEGPSTPQTTDADDKEAPKQPGTLQSAPIESPPVLEPDKGRPHY